MQLQLCRKLAAKHGDLHAHLARRNVDLLDRAAVSYQIVLTKADKIGRPALAAVTAATAEGVRRRAAAFPEIIATSAETGEGIAALQAAILTAIDPVRPA